MSLFLLRHHAETLEVIGGRPGALEVSLLPRAALDLAELLRWAAKEIVRLKAERDRLERASRTALDLMGAAKVNDENRHDLDTERCLGATLVLMCALGEFAGPEGGPPP